MSNNPATSTATATPYYVAATLQSIVALLSKGKGKKKKSRAPYEHELNYRVLYDLDYDGWMHVMAAAKAVGVEFKDFFSACKDYPGNTLEFVKSKWDAIPEGEANPYRPRKPRVASYFRETRMPLGGFGMPKDPKWIAEAYENEKTDLIVEAGFEHGFRLCWEIAVAKREQGSMRIGSDPDCEKALAEFLKETQIGIYGDR